MCLKLGKGNALLTSEANSYVLVEIVLCVLCRDCCCMADDLIRGFFLTQKEK